MRYGPERDGEANVVERLEKIRGDLVCAVFVANTAASATLPTIDGLPSSPVLDNSAPRRPSTRCATLDM
jgi:hypothetical protein